MFNTGYWEFNGKRKKPPKMPFRADYGYDKRFKVVKEFQKDKRWVYYNPLRDYYDRQMIDYITRPLHPMFKI